MSPQRFLKDQRITEVSRASEMKELLFPWWESFHDAFLLRRQYGGTTAEGRKGKDTCCVPSLCQDGLRVPWSVCPMLGTHNLPAAQGPPPDSEAHGCSLSSKRLLLMPQDVWRLVSTKETSQHHPWEVNNSYAGTQKKVASSKESEPGWHRKEGRSWSSLLTMLARESTERLQRPKNNWS